MNELMRRPALDAECAAADGMLLVRVCADDLAVLYLQDQAAADTAIGTNGFSVATSISMFLIFRY